MMRVLAGVSLLGLAGACAVGAIVAGFDEQLHHAVRHGLYRLAATRLAAVVHEAVAVAAAVLLPAGFLVGLVRRAWAGRWAPPQIAASRLGAAAIFVAAAGAAVVVASIRGAGIGPAGAAGGLLLAAAAALWLRQAALTSSARRLPNLGPGLAAAALLLATQAGVWWAGSGGSERRPNVLMIVVDCLRADHLASYGYDRATMPNLERVLGAGMRFDQAYASAPWTKPAVVSMLTGRYPNRHGAVAPTTAFPPDLPGLQRRLRDAGYWTAFYNGGNTFISHQFNFQSGWDAYHYSERVDARRLTDAVIAGLQRPRERPFAAYVHYMDAHFPYNVHPFNDAYGNPATLPEGLRPTEIFVSKLRFATANAGVAPGYRQALRNLYDGQLRWIDHHLGRLFNALAAQGQLDDTLIVVTADHGEEFWEHGNVEHGHSVYDEVLRVPLLVAGPGVPQRQVTELVNLVDVAPTIWEAAGAVAPAGADGADLLQFLRAGYRPAREAVFASGTLYGPERLTRVGDRYKLIRNTTNSYDKFHLVGPRSVVPWEFYDRVTDPGERYNLAAAGYPAMATAMTELERYRLATAGPVDRVELDASVREGLRALGYVQ